MCGIIGYKGERNASEVVIKGLKTLEYRGYDSWGISLKENGNLKVIKRMGKIGVVNNVNISGSDLGMGHTRWATHGGVTEENAHPHSSNNGNITVVHNGIIENFQELRRKLKDKGYKFKSETDTEIIPILIEEHMKEFDFVEAVRKALLELEGSYAVVVMNKEFDGLVCARKESPLVIGVGEGEYFIASDVPAFLEYTRNVIFLDDLELAVIKDDIVAENIDTNEKVETEIKKIEWSPEQAMKGDFEHFMLKEIYEQPEALRRAITYTDSEINELAKKVNGAFGTFFVACGTAFHACITASYLFSSVVNKHVNLSHAHEFPCYEQFITDKTMVIPVSQSGETADVMDAVRTSKKKKAKIFSIVNVVGSSLDRASDYRLYLKAGPEIGVASTKAYLNQITMLTLLTYGCAGKVDIAKKMIKEAAEEIEKLLDNGYSKKIREIADKIKNSRSIFSIGRALNFSTAMEAALKIKECSYIHAEGFAGGELKHGAIALIDKGTPCLVFVANDNVKKEILSNAMEIKARGGLIIGISPENNEVFDEWIQVPDIPPVSPIVNVVPAQLLAYHLAVLRGNDPDKPRNLAKSVTVK